MVTTNTKGQDKLHKENSHKRKTFGLGHVRKYSLC